MAKKTAFTAALENAIDALQKLAELSDSMGLTDASAAADSDAEQYDRDDIEGLPIKELRELAAELELDEQKVKKGILDEMESKGLFTDGESDEDEDDEEFEEEEEDEADDSDEDEEEDEDDEDEESELTREDLEEMSLADLKKLAKEEGHNASVYRKMDQDELVDLLAGDDEDEEDEDEEEEEIDEDALKAMGLPDLKKVAADLGLKVPVAVGKNKTKLVNFILENAGEEDDE